MRPEGCGGAGPSAALPLLDDAHTSPPSRRLASGPAALATRRLVVSPRAARLATGKISLDSSVIVDFYLVGRIALLEELFTGRMVMSDFVKQELIDADLQLTGVDTITLSTDEDSVSKI